MRLPGQVAFVVVALVLFLTPSTISADTPLSFEDRVRAQETIERFYHSYRIGSTRTFEQTVPDAVLREKVRTYLARSVALESTRSAPITAEDLERELARMIRNSRLPIRLNQLFELLGNDRLLIQETLVRSALVSRVDVPREHMMSFEELQPAASVASAVDSATPAAMSCEVRWENGSLSEPPVGMSFHAGVWTGTHLLVWGGLTVVEHNQQLSSRGYRYDPLTDTWSHMAEQGSPEPRFRPTAVWTGAEMIVWGGHAGGVFFDTGGRYDPTTDTWTEMETLGAPAPRSEHTAVFADGEMIVWGGSAPGGIFNDGARYDVNADSWSPVSGVGAPSMRARHSAVWTGSEMIIWGGSQGVAGAASSGGRYDPSTDSWSATSLVGAPASRSDHTAVWSGTEMIIWGGLGGADTGGRYDPSIDSWSPTSLSGAPSSRYQHSAVWNGQEMIVWGGIDTLNVSAFNTGASYNPATDSWSPTSLEHAPARRSNHVAVWAADQMLVWGGTGDFNETYYTAGGRYDASSDSWTSTFGTNNAPAGRERHVAVWTGTHMIVWGGLGIGGVNEASGGSYDPMLDRWTHTSITGAPQARRDHAAVWTGSEMIVWGGAGRVGGLNARLATGGRYDPMTDGWSTMQVAGAPAERERHTAVWSGSEMVIWGGRDGATALTDGGRYDPSSDSWSSVESAGQPSERYDHTAVWTGSEMIVWGGSVTALDTLDDGGRYDPVSNSWTPVNLVQAPEARTRHTVVWTGDEMIIWGGWSLASRSMNSGGRYDPGIDAWTPTSQGAGVPSGRDSHTAAWSGSEMLIWGGSPPTDTGAGYAPLSDSWQPLPTLMAPDPRLLHAAVWADSAMIVWGGGFGSKATGGRLVIPSNEDNDQDGYRICDGDCDDADDLINPGAKEIPGNRVDENCDGVAECHPDAAWSNNGEFVSCIVDSCKRIYSGSERRRICPGLISGASRD